MTFAPTKLPIETGFELDLLPYYVYELRDPRDNCVFYVGKGSGNRVWVHDAEGDSPKAQRYRQIVESGHEVMAVVIGRFRTEDEALAVESVLIKWTYGFENLSNLIHGHRHRLIRPHVEQVLATYETMPGIDQPRAINRPRDGLYTSQLRKEITNNQILEKLESLRDALRLRPELTGLTISDPDLTVPQDPCLLIEGVGSEAVRMQVKMQLTGETVVLNLIPTSRELVRHFEAALTRIEKPYNIRKGNNFGRYCQTHDFRTAAGGFPRGVRHDNLEDLTRMINEARDRLGAKI